VSEAVVGAGGEGGRNGGLDRRLRRHIWKIAALGDSLKTMARTAQTELAVLGALSVQPMTGYRLRSAIAETIGHFWHESFGQIYPTLHALEEAGLVVRAPSDGAAPGPFALTPAGQERLRELLAEPFSRPPGRDPLLLRLFFGRHVDPDLTRARLSEHVAAVEAQRAVYAGVRADVEAQVPDNPDARFWLVTVRAGERRAEAELTWAREALELLAD
jgi:DNA-binding PadR family transcriptional regulator